MITIIIIFIIVILYPYFKKGFEEVIIDLLTITIYLIIKPTIYIYKWLKKLKY